MSNLQQHKQQPVSGKPTVTSGKRRFRRRRPQNGGGTVKAPAPTTQAKKTSAQADKLLKVTGGRGTDIRNQGTKTKEAIKEQLLVQGQDPTLDVNVGYDDRGLQYLAMGTVLRAIRRGWLTGIEDDSQHPYYAFRYLLDAYRSAAAGTIPQLQQAPAYFWEICYALKPKTETFKTGKIKYNTASVDTLSEVDPEVLYSLGSTTENYHIYWGISTGDDPSINGFSILAGPAATYTSTLGAKAINYLWSTFPNSGLCNLVPDPSLAAFMGHDTSAQAAVYAELGNSYGVAGGLATTISNERFIQCPIMAKFCTYQEFEMGWRGWQEYRKQAGSPCYIGPRTSEFAFPKQFTNKVSPIFLMYNFDEFVEQAALILCRAMEEAAKANITVTAYPLTSLQFQIILRQALVPYFCNDMAQDLRYSGEDTNDILVTILPLVVGPNGNSVTQQGEGMSMPRFFVEMVRCCRRLTSKVKLQGKETIHEIDLVPILGRPGGIAQLGQYTWTNAGGGDVDFFKIVEEEVPIDLIECSAPSTPTPVYLDLNGPMLSQLNTIHNNWLKSVTGALTAILDLSSNEGGIPSLNLNVLTNHLNYVYGISNITTNTIPVQKTDEKGKTIPRSAIPKHRPNRGVPRPKVAENKVVIAARNERSTSKSKLPKSAGIRLQPTRVGANPSDDSDYFQRNVGVVKCTSTFPILAPIWKYQAPMVKPIFWAVANQLEGTSRVYSTFQVQPNTLAIASRNPQFVITSGQLSLPSLFEQHLNGANMDIKSWNSTTKSEMEVDFDAFETAGHGGFFADIGKAIGGWIDSF